MSTGQKRPLRRAHFAFMRAVMQGLDAKASWDRYLGAEGEAGDMRKVRSAIASIRDEFAAAAKRELRPGTARLVLMDPDRLDTASTVPTLEEFARDHGLEEFSEAEQAQAYGEAHPDARRGTASSTRQRGTPRARLIARQLEALHWLEGLAEPEPKSSDSVSVWLNPSVAARLRRAQISTLRALVDHINGAGDRWWRSVPGVGTQKAARVVAWLEAHSDVSGLVLAPHAAHRAAPESLSLASAGDAAPALLPLEKIVAPPGLDGRDGIHRGPRSHCKLSADVDLQAVAAWLNPEGSALQAAPRSPATLRAYRKEAERLLLWCFLVRRKALSSLDPGDASSYLSFLGAPPPEWCGSRHHPRASPKWRPMEGPLTANPLKQVHTVLKALYNFWIEQGYVTINPFLRVTKPASGAGGTVEERAFNAVQWVRIEAALDGRDKARPVPRLARAVRWLYATGLRIGELATARCSDLIQVDAHASHIESTTAWCLHVPSRRGAKRRQVPVPLKLIAELERSLEQSGLPAAVNADANADVAILASFGQARVRPWTSSGLAKALKQWLALIAEELPEVESDAYRQASAHWFRRTHGFHALEGRGGRTAVPIGQLQARFGHAAPRTTRAYLKPARDHPVPAPPAVRR